MLEENNPDALRMYVRTYLVRIFNVYEREGTARYSTALRCAAALS